VTSGAATATDAVDWGLARRVAHIVSGREPLADSYLAASLETDFIEVSAEAEVLVADFTGLRPPNRAAVQLLDRRGWIDANISSMRELLAPLLDKMGDRMARSPIAPIGRRVAGTETGVLLGYVAQRVLGQYDLLVPESGDAVYYVGPNVLALEKRFGFRPREFRKWIALHELTHRAQFTGIPWLRSYFLSLVRDTVGGVDLDPRRFVSLLARAADDLRRGRNPVDEGGLLYLLAAPDQRAALERVQALMSLLEGHGNAVMNRLGARYVEGQARMASVLEARRRNGGLTAVLHRLMGLELKLRQYELGESFVDGVEALGGSIDVAWRGPEWLPTLVELAEPETWWARVSNSELPPPR